MIEKIKRNKIILKQDITKPKNIDDLIQKYDLENEKIYNYLDYLVEKLTDTTIIYEFTKEIYLKNTGEWYDTGISGPDLPESGTYIMEVSINCFDVCAQYVERLVGVVAWFINTTNSNNADEIPLSKAGHARNDHNIKLRIIRQQTPGHIKLQISDTIAWTGKGNISIKFKKIL